MALPRWVVVVVLAAIPTMVLCHDGAIGVPPGEVVAGNAQDGVQQPVPEDGAPPSWPEPAIEEPAPTEHSDGGQQGDGIEAATPHEEVSQPPELHGEHTSETVHDETQSGDQVESRSAQEERFEDAARHSPPTDHNHDDQPDGHQLAREEPPQPQELPEQHDSKTSHATTHTHAQDTSGHEEGLEVGDSSAPSPQHQEIDVQQILTGIENRLVRQLSDLESRLRDTLESNVGRHASRKYVLHSNA